MLCDSSLEGYRIPNVKDRLIAMLFTDNTTVYLSNRDSWEELRSILDLWCQASGAKFNIEKTQVIPIGNLDYRCAVVEMRRIGLMQDAIPVNVHIAHDGEAVRILGAFVGNAVDMAAPWTQILDHIQEKCDMWEWMHPTIEGRRLLIQIYAGGLTQFLTQAQGMLDSVLMQVQRMICNFAWDNQGKTSMNKSIMLAVIADGGMQVLDIKMRNDAIEVMKLKSYLRFDANQPSTVYVKDAIINQHIKKGTPQVKAMANTVLQTWTVNVTHNTQLP
ncbi:hypothetical protein ARMGADRAFT_942241 [Armillaria gallica]|uniref:Reverse transcriptase domain-containing protein n=1 Tax=Armillaria gallica TaxID=47427 RepID=A0A2H3CTR7_ARMGA|nr:hypothetical protein ARMGADRAFT_942241 [Armillaria gallica]